MFKRIKQYFCEHKEKGGWYRTHYRYGYTLYSRYCEKCDKDLSFSQMEYGREHTYAFGYETDMMLARWKEQSKPKLLEYQPEQNK